MHSCSSSRSGQVHCTPTCRESSRSLRPTRPSICSWYARLRSMEMAGLSCCAVIHSMVRYQEWGGHTVEGLIRFSRQTLDVGDTRKWIAYQVRTARAHQACGGQDLKIAPIPCRRPGPAHASPLSRARCHARVASPRVHHAQSRSVGHPRRIPLRIAQGIATTRRLQFGGHRGQVPRRALDGTRAHQSRLPAGAQRAGGAEGGRPQLPPGRAVGRGVQSRPNVA